VFSISIARNTHYNAGISRVLSNDIEERQKLGEFKKDIDSKQLTSIIMDSLQFNLIQWHLSCFSMNLSKLFDVICKLILNK
jgi:hypothetical protein